MLYWICPECGHECSPAIRDCPTCTAPPLHLLAAAVSLSPASPELLKLSPAPVPARNSAPAIAPAPASPRVKFGFKLADLTPPGPLNFKPARISGLAIFEPLKYQPPEPARISSGLKPLGESLSDLAIDAIHVSFLEQPPVGLLPAPERVLKAPAPPIHQCIRSVKLELTPAPPENSGRSTLTAGPQPPTLAGPCLPSQLRNLMNAGNAGRHPNRRRVGVPNWLLTIVVVTALCLGVGSLLQYLTSARNASASSLVPKTQVPKPPVALPVVEEHPAARSVEVAGIRIVTGLNKKPQLQYVVINHSPNELTGLNIRIALRSVDALDGLPLLSVSSVVPSLGPSQSREVRADLDPFLKLASIPDWQSLRPEILIARQ